MSAELAADAGELPARPDPGEPPVQTGQEEGSLECERDQGEDQSDLLRAEEHAVLELQQLVPAVSHDVGGGEEEAEPAQPGLDRPELQPGEVGLH